MLLTDAVYEPVRRFCAEHLARLGIECTYYRPDGAGIEALIRPNTRMIYAESPGSLTYEMPDLSELSTAARKHARNAMPVARWLLARPEASLPILSAACPR